MRYIKGDNCGLLPADVRHEAAQVGGDWKVRFTNPDARRGVALYMSNNPTSEDRIHSVETLQGSGFLVHKPFLAVGAACLDFDPRSVERYISTLAPEQGFLHPVRAGGPFEARGEQVRMVRV